MQRYRPIQMFGHAALQYADNGPYVLHSDAEREIAAANLRAETADLRTKDAEQRGAERERAAIAEVLSEQAEHAYNRRDHDCADLLETIAETVRRGDHHAHGLPDGLTESDLIGGEG